MSARMRGILLGTAAALLLCMYALGLHTQAQAQPALVPLPLCTAYEIALDDAAHAQGHGVRMGCEDSESLTGTPGITAPEGVTLYTCTSEDGSDPGQEFPCLWNAQAQGNGQGMSYILTAAQ